MCVTDIREGRERRGLESGSRKPQFYLVKGQRLDSMILETFYNLNDSLILERDISELIGVSYTG